MVGSSSSQHFLNKLGRSDMNDGFLVYKRTADHTVTDFKVEEIVVVLML